MKHTVLTITILVFIVGAVSAVPPSGVQAIDLGLPSGTKWANMNVGATSPTNGGNRYNWGEIEATSHPACVINWRDYKWSYNKSSGSATNNIIKYCTQAQYGYNGYVDNKTTLEPEDDVAFNNWGNGWRTPTKAEWEELVSQCKWELQNNGFSWKVTGPNGCSITLPLPDISGSETCVNRYDGYYMSSSLSGTSNKNYCLALDHICSGEQRKGVRTYDRCEPQHVRPVVGMFVSTNFTITFNANGGLIPTNGNMGNTPAGHTTTLSADRKTGTVVVTTGQGHFNGMGGDCPNREGYVFDGWWTSATGGTQVYDATGACIKGTAYWNANLRWIGTSDLTVYAHWISIEEKVLPGKFSINDSTMVRFAPGNLQYRATPGTHICADGTTKPGIWRFAEHQYDAIGLPNKNISETYASWIDLFGWGTSGWNSGAIAYQPWQISAVQNDYLQISLQGEKRLADWAVYNPIINGGNITEKWRCLTREEWIYLLEKRPNCTSLIGYATIQSTTGVILLPDHWVTPTGMEFHSILPDYSANVYTQEQWEKMEEAGAIFLPAAGYRSTTNQEIIKFNIGGWYCSSSVTSSSSADTSYPVSSALLRFSTDSISMHNDDHRFAGGRSVRPIRQLTRIRAVTGNPSMGSTSGGGFFENNEELIISATPLECYRFVRWSDGNTSNPRTVTVTGDATYTAVFEKNMLVLDDIEDNSELLTNVLGEEWDVLLDNRTLRGAMWNTLCLPFDVPTLVGTPLEGATVAEFVRATGDALSGLSLEFAAVSSLQAGKPYLLTPTADVENPVFEQVTISAMDGETILGDGNVHFVGILEPTHLLSGNQDYLFVGANNRLYYPAMDDVGTMRAFRAYFNVTGPALVGRRLPARVVLHEQTPTNLTETSDDVLVRKFIRQGILIIERDGIEYNAQGMRLSK